MSKDFLAKQIKSGKIIGNNPSSNEPELIIYPEKIGSGSSEVLNASNSNGGFSSELASRLNKVGLDAFIYIDGIPGSKKLGTENTVAVFGGDVVISGCLYETNSGSSLWELDPLDSDNLIPTNVIDGDTGLFAIDFNVFDTTEIFQYTTTGRLHGADKFFEFDSSENIIPKDSSSDAC